MRNGSFPDVKRCEHRVVDSLKTMQVFVRVGQRSGFAAAARDLRMSPAAVTKHIAALEKRLNARLFDRTTRQVALTEAGRVYLERCLACLQAFDDADNSVRQLTLSPRGLLRVTAPVDLQHDLPPIVARFLAAHPAVTVHLNLTNRPVSLVEEGLDVAVRVASPSLSGDYVARLLAPLPMGVAASPAHLREHGRPHKPQDLAHHRNLVFIEPQPRLRWTFARGGARTEVTVNPVLSTNSGTALVVAAAADAGITIAPIFTLRPFLEAGSLVLLLTDWKIEPDLRLFAVYPHRRFLSPNVTSFVEALRQGLGVAP